MAPQRDLKMKYKIGARKKLNGERDTICELHREIWCLIEDKLTPDQKELKETLKELVERAYDFGKRMSVKLQENKKNAKV